MSDYRLYCLDAKGQISLADWIDADSDEDAVLRARARARGAHKCEVWHKTRLIGKLSSNGRFERGDS